MQTRSFRLFGGFGQKKVENANEGVNAIQRIYDSLASITNIEESMRLSSKCPHISACLESMSLVSLADLGLTEDYVENAKDNVCMNIVNSREFDIQVFVIPKGKQLPLHDHPNMIVLSKLISGTLSVRSFSPDRSSSSNSQTSAGNAALTLSAKRNPSDGAWLLSPNEGNIHELISENTAIVLDVLLPPYSEPDRPCNFYRSVERDGQWLLEDSPPPPNRQLPNTMTYKGTKPTLREIKW
eukprot:CAMPEP_0119040476 /NCGR_PEP_ID=MMETSP1177-20130426/10396_1 /TAXON_ID=2985 /ORGANISM="Ochromonas sp, Strain CCMP1899" /LENGTH=239 /DNA_ID=CAMNT_0007005539 /DNA_START=292 /DNA_END=1008 /DNA_ORIENTATION=+